MATETTLLASRAGVTLERKVLRQGVGQIAVKFVLNGPGPQSRTFSSEVEARKAFEAAVEAQ